uniref:Uncharacterized protein n=1 Tax=Octopus bimaculoides TaxID=37653 RepID=A0A0L8HC43_OCTBM
MTTSSKPQDITITTTPLRTDYNREPTIDQGLTERQATRAFLISKPKKPFFRQTGPKPGHSIGPTKCEIPKVINLSHKTLSNQQIKILTKGLKFTPTPQRSNLNNI